MLQTIKDNPAKSIIAIVGGILGIITSIYVIEDRYNQGYLKDRIDQTEKKVLLEIKNGFLMMVEGEITALEIKVQADEANAYDKAKLIELKRRADILRSTQ